MDPPNKVPIGKIIHAIFLTKKVGGKFAEIAIFDVSGTDSILIAGIGSGRLGSDTGLKITTREELYCLVNDLNEAFRQMPAT